MKINSTYEKESKLSKISLCQRSAGGVLTTHIHLQSACTNLFFVIADICGQNVQNCKHYSTNILKNNIRIYIYMKLFYFCIYAEYICTNNESIKIALTWCIFISFRVIIVNLHRKLFELKQRKANERYNNNAYFYKHIYNNCTFIK